ncbi:hypothetical protein J6590_051964 [Homalodisca vitripennis]|nr:hypothetical protein J6590_051964 [Homalodisca vitripennis]
MLYNGAAAARARAVRMPRPATALTFPLPRLARSHPGHAVIQSAVLAFTPESRLIWRTGRPATLTGSAAAAGISAVNGSPHLAAVLEHLDQCYDFTVLLTFQFPVLSWPSLRETVSDAGLLFIETTSGRRRKVAAAPGPVAVGRERDDPPRPTTGPNLSPPFLSRRSFSDLRVPAVIGGTAVPKSFATSRSLNVPV